MAMNPPPGDQRLPGNIDLSPPEEFDKRPDDAVLWLYNNFSLVQAALQATFHDVGAFTWTIADDTAPSNIHVVHVNVAGNVTIYLPSNPNDGEIFLVKDAIGDAGTFNKVVRVTGATGTIDGAALFSMTFNYAWFLCYGYNGNYYRLG